MSELIYDIDIKNTHIYLRDGKGVQMSATSLVAAAADVGDTEITFDAGTVAEEEFEIGMWIAIGALMRPRYFITEIVGEVITIHAPLHAALEDDDRLYRSDWNELDIEIGEGNLTWSAKISREYKMSRGRLNRVKNADEEPMDVSIDAIWQSLQSLTGETVMPYEALVRQYAAAAWVSSGGECQPYALDVVVDHEPDCAELDNPNELLIFPEFRVNSIDGDLSGSTLAAPGQCLAVLPIAIRY